MRDQRVVIAGLARNIAAILPKTVARVERLGSCFRDYRVVVYENDSSDGTLAQLQQWQSRNPRVALLSESCGDPVNRPVRCLDVRAIIRV